MSLEKLTTNFIKLLSLYAYLPSFQRCANNTLKNGYVVNHMTASKWRTGKIPVVIFTALKASQVFKTPLDIISLFSVASILLFQTWDTNCVRPLLSIVNLTKPFFRERPSNVGTILYNNRCWWFFHFKMELKITEYRRHNFAIRLDWSLLFHSSYELSRSTSLQDYPKYFWILS